MWKTVSLRPMEPTLRTTAETYTVTEPLDADGTCRVHDRRADTTYRIVDVADGVTAAKLARRSIGDTVRLDLAPADPDGLDWIATRLRPGAPTTSGAAR